MRYLVLTAFVTTVLLSSGHAQQPLPYELTQAGMNEAAYKSCQAAEAEMNRVYTQLLARAKDKPEAIATLKKAQQAWLAYREAQLAAEWSFPSGNNYGSVLRMCQAKEQERLTRLRTRELRSMLHPIKGDCCGSSWPE